MDITFKSFPVRPYHDAHEEMKLLVDDIYHNITPPQIWFLEHEPVYTSGTSAKESDLLNPKFPIYKTGRGGQYTYHGPGQLVCYSMIKLNTSQQDLKAYVKALMDLVSLTLKQIGCETFFDNQNIGLWIKHKNTQKKIAAFGIRVSKWVTWHGFSININPNLSHFDGIIPCGIKKYGVTSLEKEGINVTRTEIERLLKNNFSTIPFFY